jgi:hypothetical protein
MRGVLLFLLAMGVNTGPALAAMTEYPKVRLRSLDKITARSMTFDAAVGTTVKFGSMYIKVLSCQKPDLQERPDAASFMQVWEITQEDVSKWIFSGWMFASSPALSALDHPIYDVWVLDCLSDEKTPKAGPNKSIEDIVQDATGATPPQLLINPSELPAETGVRESGPVINAVSVERAHEAGPAHDEAQDSVTPPNNSAEEWSSPQTTPDAGW